MTGRFGSCDGTSVCDETGPSSQALLECFAQTPKLDLEPAPEVDDDDEEEEEDEDEDEDDAAKYAAEDEEGSCFDGEGPKAVARVDEAATIAAPDAESGDAAGDLRSAADAGSTDAATPGRHDEHWYASAADL